MRSVGEVIVSKGQFIQQWRRIKTSSDSQKGRVLDFRLEWLHFRNWKLVKYSGLRRYSA